MRPASSFLFIQLSNSRAFYAFFRNVWKALACPCRHVYNEASCEVESNASSVRGWGVVTGRKAGTAYDV